MKMSVDQALRKARALAKNGQGEEAQDFCREILERFPGNRRAMLELQALLAPRIENPPQFELDGLVALYHSGRWSEATARADALVERFPHGEILRNIAGAIHAAAGRPADALVHYDVAVALASDYLEAHSNRGNALKDLKRLGEALESYDAALRLKPDYAEALINRGIALFRMKRIDEALASYDKGIALSPALAEAWNNRGNALREIKRSQDALNDYDRAIALNPTYADAWVNRGNALRWLRRLEDAILSYDRAIELAPGLAEAHSNRGTVLKELKRPEAALASHRRAFALKPDFAVALADILNLKAHMCDWTEVAGEQVAGDFGVTGQAVPPFYMLSLSDDPARQRACSELWTKAQYGHEATAYAPLRKPDGKIRIGYFSADFHNHATTCLMAGLLERHDRDRFEVHGFSYGVDVDDRMRRRVVAGVDVFHNVTDTGDAAIAALSREAGIDIAIDLKGHTETSRSGIFAFRAAPVQIAYLGYPGTTGGDFIDYVIADRIVIPEADQHHWSEKVLYLSGSYQVNDDKRVVADTVPTRAELGLPEQGFVFCSFNNNYKITPAEYDIWMRLLARVEGSVLWLLNDNDWAAANLRREAAARGIDPARIVFAERTTVAEHMARQVHADLFLDTFAINAHTTASDALWMGLPVLTKLGNSFVARVAGSLLYAVGLPELVTETAEDYEALALKLATEPARLAEIRAKLAAGRDTAPLFDTERTTREIEALYEQVYAAHFGVVG